jgi:N-methylhydantoinase A/oxoprolinase/acetone carboxylase beta subunit
MHGDSVLASHKAPTSANIRDGVVNAITTILCEANKSSADIDAVMIGTTQFTNAFVERRHLSRVGVIRLCLPATRGLPPMVDWPADIAEKIGDHRYLVGGGYEFDGREIAPLDELEIMRIAKQLKRDGITSVAISGVFSPVKSDMEKRAAEIVAGEMPDANITLSSRIGRISLLERENAGIMNASLSELASRVVTSFADALSQLNIDAPFYISQNDGTLMTAEHVGKYPVLTFASGPTNSMRGAAYLSGVKNALVADIGGTTTDIGMLANGFPRESSVTTDIGDVRTNFRMPDIFAMGLGGGSIVSSLTSPVIGPQSVGFRLTELAKVFGGDVLTATDIAVRAGYAKIGDASKVSDIPQEFVDATVSAIHSMLESGIDRIKTSAEPLPLILVGGGAILINRDISGASEVIVPEYAGVANAIGASIAQAGGEVDQVYSYDDSGRDAAIGQARQDAINAAVSAGAIEDTVEVLDIEEIPLSYVPGGTVRIRVKTAGDLAL